MDNVPIFIKIDEYKDVVDILARTREQIGQARHLISRISEIKGQEDEMIEKWAKELEDVEQRVEEVDKMLVHQQTQ